MWPFKPKIRPFMPAASRFCDVCRMSGSTADLPMMAASKARRAVMRLTGEYIANGYANTTIEDMTAAIERMHKRDGMNA